MGLAEQQHIPGTSTKPVGWTRKALLGAAPIVKGITTSFTSAYDWFLLLTILIIMVGELVVRHVSWLIYILAIFFLLASLAERWSRLVVPEKTTKK